MVGSSSMVPMLSSSSRLTRLAEAKAVRPPDGNVKLGTKLFRNEERALVVAVVEVDDRPNPRLRGLLLLVCDISGAKSGLLTSIDAASLLLVFLLLATAAEVAFVTPVLKLHRLDDAGPPKNLVVGAVVDALVVRLI